MFLRWLFLYLSTNTPLYSLSFQHKLKTGQRELQVLDYQNVAHTLVGLTASAYACWFMGQNMQGRYQK